MRIDPSSFLTPAEVALRIKDALNLRRPFSLIRIGDGEALAMAQDTIVSMDEIYKQRFLRYAGITAPDLKARDELLAMLALANLIGVPSRWDLPYFSPLVERIFEQSRITPANQCDCCINYQLHQERLLLPLFERRRTLLIGRRSRELASVLIQYHGISVVGKIMIDNYRQIPSVLRACRDYYFDIAFVSAGIPAITICAKIASQLGKVALDLGHLADRMIEEYL